MPHGQQFLRCIVIFLLRQNVNSQVDMRLLVRILQRVDVLIHALWSSVQSILISFLT